MRADAVQRGDIIDGKAVTSVFVNRHHASIRTADGVLTRYHRGENVEVIRQQGEQGAVTL